MGFLHAREPSRAPRPPPGLVRTSVRFGAAAQDAASPLEAARDEWFLQGTEQPVFAMDSGADGAYPASAGGQEGSKSSGTALITAPAPGTIIALDPDIPPARQRLQFTATGGSGLRWRINGQPLGRGARTSWLLWPGRHQVQLTDASGQVLDEVRIEVRGAGVAPHQAAQKAGGGARYR